ATAMKWLTRLGEFVQRRVSQQTRSGEQTTLVQETVWSPGGNTQQEREPLFDRSQSRRLHEMALAAPQLYGAVQRSGGGSDSSRSFTKEQLESEVKRQIDQAMSEQRAVNEENQRLRLEVERLKAEAENTSASMRAAEQRSDNPPAARDLLVQRQAEQIAERLEGNLAGLPGHGAILLDFGNVMEGRVVIGLWAFMEYLEAIHQDSKDVSSSSGLKLVKYPKVLRYLEAILEDFRGVTIAGVVRLQGVAERSGVIFQDFRDMVVSMGGQFELEVRVHREPVFLGLQGSLEVRKDMQDGMCRLCLRPLEADPVEAI
ncbi:GIP, partial [Symbiodinium sp. CCMP2592]